MSLLKGKEMASDFVFPIPDRQSRRLAVGWLILSIASLVIAGLFSIILVLSRTPYVQDIFPMVDFFHVALVVHVDLSVLIWFLSFAGVFFSINSTPRWTGLGWLALSLSASGTSIIAISPFIGAKNPLMNNYVPVLQDHIFLIGLAIFAAGFTLLLVRSLFTAALFKRHLDSPSALRFGIYIAAVAASTSMIAFVWSYLSIPDDIYGERYYEILFWGGGHVLQFVHTMLMLVSWLWLASASGAVICLNPRIATIIFGLGLIPAFITPIIYLSYDVTSFEHIDSFTMLMKYGMGLPVLLTGFAVAAAILRGKAIDSMRHIKAALISSMILFAAGGIIGFLIHGTNVTIPSHYHGAIVGVTLSYMGVTYYLLPHLGFSNPSARLAHIQPYIYGGGQLLHILGLAWAGGYGVQRKVAGSAQGLATLKEIASMGLMGIGGLMAVIGGFLFLIVVIRAMLPHKQQERIPTSPAQID
ncbi:MAG: cbb3-type cytochrome c oxidase subunit I [Thermodesulfovibrionales bacterium]